MIFKVKITEEQARLIKENEDKISFDSLVIAIRDNDYVLVDKNTNTVMAVIAPTRVTKDKKKICELAVDAYQTLFENNFNNKMELTKDNVIGDLTSCKLVSEDIFKDFLKNVSSDAKPDIRREINKMALKEEFNNFISGLYSGIINYEYNDFVKMLEGNGYLEEGRIVSSKFNNDSNLAKKLLFEGFKTFIKTKNPRKSIKILKEGMELSDITPEYFRNQMYGKPKTKLTKKQVEDKLKEIRRKEMELRKKEAEEMGYSLEELEDFLRKNVKRGKRRDDKNKDNIEEVTSTASVGGGDGYFGYDVPFGYIPKKKRK